ncbi:MAG TPA: hypothetical protein VJS67_11680 [Pseudonocardiaceae bacterium]|nr:hypothetical protein [Pseudonocardiaceae bacterium]
MRFRRLAGLAGLAVGSVALVVAGYPASAFASVSPSPASGTPQLAATGTTEQVRQLVQCGGMIYAVGSFTAIKWHGTVYARKNVFRFSATSPFTMSPWVPNANGKVNSIALSSGCSVAYLGGHFSSVHGAAVRNIAAVSTSTGRVIASFRHNANGQVETLLRHNGHLLAGGYFTTINGSGRRYMISLNPATGRDDGFIRLRISGHYQYPGVSGNATRVYNQQLSHSGTLDLVEGVFTSVGGKSRQQIFMLRLDRQVAAVTGWTSREFNQHCHTTEPFYVRAASWSPDDSTVYIGTTGFHPFRWNRSFPLTGLCDVAAAFPATKTTVRHNWVNYTGCDSLYSTAADSTTAYFGGHERWSQNRHGCDSAGPGAISAPGMEGLSPSTGHLTFNPTRSRGLGADDMLVTRAGLWIASDNLQGSTSCGGVSGHAGICFLPYS